MGVDRNQHLWAWNEQSSEVHIVSLEGIQVTEKIGAAIAIDADREWGAAGLYFGGHELRVTPFGGGPVRNLELKNHAAQLAWINGDLIAVSPTTALHRAEVWSLSQKTVVATLGQDDATSLIGRSKVVFLDFNPTRKLLYVLESLTGELQAFSTDWKLVKETRVPHPKLSSYEEFIRDHVASSASIATDLVAFSAWDGFSLDRNGDIWMVRDYDYPGHITNFVKVSFDSNPQTMPMSDVECGSMRLALWGSSLIAYRDPMNPRKACVTVRTFL